MHTLMHPFMRSRARRGNAARGVHHERIDGPAELESGWPRGGSGCGGGPFAPTACHTHPRWQAASQPSHPSLPCLTVLLLHLVELPEVGEQHFPRSSQLARAKLQIAQRGRGEHSYFEASTFKHPSSAILDQKNQFRCLQYYKVNRCLARYSPRATTANRPTNRAPKKPAWPGPYQPKMPILGQIWSFWGKKSFFFT